MALFAALVAIAAPLALVLLEGLVGLAGPGAARWVHRLLVAALFALLALVASKRVTGGVGAVPVAALAGVLATIAYCRSAAFRSLLSLLGIAPLVIVALFLLRPSMATLLRPDAADGIAEVAIGSPAPVVFVVFDEFSGLSLMDEKLDLDAARYPGFARLARDSYWFRNATTVNFRTETAVPALLSGLYPTDKRLPLYGDHPNNLFTLLGGSYDVIAMETLTRLCPQRLCRSEATASMSERLRSLLVDAAVVEGHVLLPAPWAAALPPIDERWAGFGGAREGSADAARRRGRQAQGADSAAPHIQTLLRTDRAQLFSQFLDAIGGGDDARPRLYFLHILLPHTPWSYLPSGRRYGGGTALDGVRNGIFVDDPWRVTLAVQRYLLQVGYADRLVGQLIARLEAVGLYDRAMVVVTADHGVSSIPGEPRRSLGATGYPELLSVPLFVKLPGQSVGVVSDRNVEIIDILPTVAHGLGARVPWRTDGRSALDETAAERREKRFAKSFDDGVEWRTFDKDLPEKQRSVGRLVEIFGTGTTRPGGVYAIGPYHDLVGRPVPPEAPVDPALGVSHDVGPFRNVRLDSSVPARLSGTVIGGEARSMHLAIGVNGTIAAVTRTSAAARRRPFTAMLSDTALRDGSNEIEVLEIRDEDGHPALYRIPHTSRR